jgi:outer membrane protein TolC
LNSARAWRFVERCLALVAGATLAGCARAGIRKTLVHRTPSGSNSKTARDATAPDAEWWKSFNDPALDRLIDLAYGQNLTLQVAGLRILEARARLGYAHGQRYPQLQAAISSFTANEPSELAVTTFQPGSYNDYQIGFDASWEIDFWGRYRKGVTAEESGFLATIADHDNALVSLAAEVARTYTSIRTFEVLIELARGNVTVQEEGLRIAQARFDNGATSELDVMQARTLLESTRATIPQLESSLQQAENALSTLLGQTTGSLGQLLEGPAAIPGGAAAGLDQRAGRDVATMSRHPRSGAQRDGAGGPHRHRAERFLSAHRAVRRDRNASQRRRQQLQRLVQLRQLALFVRAAAALDRLQLRPHQEQRPRRGRAVPGVARELPGHGAARRAEANGALTAFLRSQEAAVFARNAADAAQQSVDLAFVQYREGAVDFQRVLDAQRSLLEEENTLTGIDSSVATSLIALYKALGGGWEMEQDQPYINDGIRDEMQRRTNWGDYFSETPSDVVSD